MSVTGTRPAYLDRNHTDGFSIELARDILETPDTDQAAREWAAHTLTLPISGASSLPGEHGTTSAPRSSGSGSRRTSKTANPNELIGATGPQIRALVNLGAKKLIGDATFRHMAADVRVQDVVDRAVTSPKTFVTKGEASKALDFLTSAPWKPRPAAAKTAPVKSERVTQDGMYRLGDLIVKVQIAKQGSGNLYAKRLVQADDTKSGWTFEYAPGLINQLKAEDRMSLEEAKEFGALYGVCCVCAADLTDEKSIAAGIGPTCGKRV